MKIESSSAFPLCCHREPPTPGHSTPTAKAERDFFILTVKPIP
jgi:hypothetical protein